MKKTMLALMATVGLAFGAKADVLNSTGFEGYSGQFDYSHNDSGEGATPYYWAVTNTSADLSQTVLTPYGESATPVKVPDAFVDAETTNKYLKVDTGADVLYRSVGALDNVEALNVGTAIGEGLYFDANVQFTASDGEPTYDSADKLVVWLKATEGENPTTNLVVTAAASINAAGEPQNVGNYEVSNITVDADKWYRLTVKALLDDDKKPYFNVYIDDVLVEADETSNFYSMVNPNTTEGRKITAVGFQGTGAVDNLVWTTEDPFPPEATYTLALTLEDEDGAITAVTVNGTEYEIDDASEGLNVTFSPATETLTISVDLFDGYAIDGWESAEKVITVSEAVQEGVIALTLTVTAAGGGEVPESAEVVADGGKVTVKAASEKEAVDAVTVKGVNGTVYADSQKYYTKVATPNGDNWDVTVALNKTALEADVDTAVAEALEDVGAAEVTLPAGFYYMVESGTDVSISTKAYGTSTGAAIGITGLGKDAGFFKVSVDTTSFEE